jgi:hypothetical protein
MTEKADEFYDFDQCNRDSKIGEEMPATLFKQFYAPIADRFLCQKSNKYGLTPKQTQAQLNGEDGKYVLRFSYDVKMIRNYYPDEKKLIFLEIMSTGNIKNTLGWFLTSKADVIFWLCGAKENKVYPFEKGYYLFLDNIRQWLIGDKEIISQYILKKNRYPSKRGNQTWDTYNLRIPPSSFPDNCILEIPKSTFKTPIEKSFFNEFFGGVL